MEVSNPAECSWRDPIAKPIIQAVLGSDKRGYRPSASAPEIQAVPPRGPLPLGTAEEQRRSQAEEDVRQSMIAAKEARIAARQKRREGQAGIAALGG